MGILLIIVDHKQFQGNLMSSNTHKNQIQSLSSLSLQQGFSHIRDSQVFPAAHRKSSFDLVNLLADSNHPHFNLNKLQKSLDILNSNIAINRPTYSPLTALLQYTDQDRHRIERNGGKVRQIDQIDSQSDPYEDEEHQSDPQGQEWSQVKQEQNNYNMIQYLPQDLTKLLQEMQVPLQYVRGLLLVREQKEIKSLRKLKVERYLQKRRNKTWNKKICYNCRQKVAQQRLRIKGKFIKKRRAMHILGLTTPISTVEVRRMLEEMLKDKSLKEIEDIIKKEDDE